MSDLSGRQTAACEHGGDPAVCAELAAVAEAVEERQKGRPTHDEATVALVRAVMDYIDGECSADYPGEHRTDDEGCDACAFDALLQALPHALRRDAVRYKPVIAP